MRRFITFLLLLSVGCANQAPTATPTQETHGHHHHPAPHGGTLIVFGQETAHLELVLEQESGKLTGYVLDGGAENGLRLTRAALEIDFETTSGSETVVLKPVADELTGETAEETSRFSGTHDSLKGVPSFRGVLKKLEIKGQVFENTEFDFPEGNEHEGHSPN